MTGSPVDGSEAIAGAASVGQIIASKYRIEEVIGVGGMGVVVAARHVQLGQRVAIKFLLPHVLEAPELVARFLREAQAATRIASEHIARVTDVGTLETGAPYMVMEHLEGEDLGSVLSNRGPLEIATAVDYIMQALQALAEAHSKGIVHRDVKPSNLFLTKRPDGTALVKLLDFGIAKTLPSEGSAQAALTQSVGLMGSPMYMSPEQVRSAKNVDSRADIWAVGVTLYELISGCSPFHTITPTAVIASIVSDVPRSLRSLNEAVSPELEAAILGCLEKDADARTADVTELAQQLVPFGTRDSALSLERISGVSGRALGGPASAPMVSVRVDKASARSVNGWADTAVSTAGTEKRSRRVWLIAAAVVVTCGLATLFCVRVLRAPEPKPQVPITTTTASADPSAPVITIASSSASPTPPPSAPALDSSAASSTKSRGGPPGKSDKSRPAPPPGDGKDLGKLIDERR